ncbi:MAG: DUF3466 family protein [Pirellulales bacterium]
MQRKDLCVLLRAAGFGVWSILAMPIVAAAVSYNIIDLGTLDNYYHTGNNSFGHAINNNGLVTGDSKAPSPGGYAGPHAFLYDGTMHDLGTLGGIQSYGNGINDDGLIVGQSDTEVDAVSHAFLYDGTMHDLGTLGGDLSGAFAINSVGQITGYSFLSGTVSHAFVYDGTMHDLGTLGGTYGSGNAINENGQIAGESNITGNGATHAFFYDGTMHDLSTLGGTNSHGSGINDIGQVVGQSETIGDSELHAFLYDGTMHDLGTLGGTESYGYDINNNGQIVGQSFITDNNGIHAFVYDSVHGMVDLNSLIDPLSGWYYLSRASAINDMGQITGWGQKNNGELHAFLLTPIPEPSSLALAIGALCTALLGNRVRTPADTATSFANSAGGRRN